MRIVRRTLVCSYIVVYAAPIKLIGATSIFERFFVFRTFKNSSHICIKLQNPLPIHVAHKKPNMMAGTLMKISMTRSSSASEK